MGPEHEIHLKSIGERFVARLGRKYRAGQVEHGGKLWLKKNLINMALDEAIDLPTYLYSLKDQLDNLHCPTCGEKITVGEVDEQSNR